MLNIDDYTALPAGAEVPLEGRVGRCPRCGRNGIEQEAQEGSFFLHVQTSEILGDGMRMEPRDCCRV